MVLDSTVLIDHLRDLPEASTFLARLTEAPLCSEVTRSEIIRGLRSAERSTAERLLALIGWVPVGEAIARRAGELGRQYRRTHPGIGTTDLLVAATAFELDETLATANVKHFPMFRGLRPPY